MVDVRSKKLEPVAQSEDQEDELLSILAIKGCVSTFSRSLGVSSSFVAEARKLSSVRRSASCQYSTAKAVGATASTAYPGTDIGLVFSLPFGVILHRNRLQPPRVD